MNEHMQEPMRVLIADDESMQREILKIAIPWKENGFSICGEARNGAQALELCLSLKPDIILVDVNMPLLDGLGLIEKMREAGCACRAIIISGYDEFVYARRAITLGVDDYLLKPIDEVELLKQVQRIRDQVLKKKQIDNSLSTMHQQAEENFRNLRRDFFRNLAHNVLDAEELKEQAADFQLAQDNPLVAAVIEVQQQNGSIRSSSEFSACRFGIARVLTDLFDAEQETILFSDGLDQLGVVVIDSTGALDEDVLLARFRAVQAYLLDHMHISVHIGIGDIVHRIGEFTSSYEHAMETLKRAVMFQGSSVSKFEKTSIEPTTNGLISAQRTEFMLRVKTGNRTAVYEQIQAILSTSAMQNATLKDLQNLVFSFLSVMREVMDEYHGAFDFLTFSYKEMQNIFDGFHSTQEMINWLDQLADRCIEEIGAYSNASSHIEKVKQYIQGNYSNSDLRIEHIAKAVYLSENYLSAIFAQKCGMSIVEYLTFVRLSQGKALLDSHQFSAAEVAEKVGYLDPNYFSKCFKKKYGMSPHQYLQMNKT